VTHPAGMRASARIVAVTDGRGGTRLPVLRGQPPLLPRRTGPGGPGPATVHLVGGAAGPLGGDVLHLEIVVGPGASLRLGSVAATVALPGRGGAPSCLTVDVTVAEDGDLHWLPEPLIAARGCRHHTASTVDLAEGARLMWRDELVCGRHREPSGDATLSTVLRYAGRTLYRSDLAVGPSAPGWAGPAVLGGARVNGTLLVVDPTWASTGPPPAATLGPTAARLPLSGPGVLIAATGADLPQVRRQCSVNSL